MTLVESWWVVTDGHEVVRLEGVLTSPDSEIDYKMWYFKALGQAIPSEDVYVTEEEAKVVARRRIKKQIAYYEEKLERLK